eukprot:2134363-Alexandrium_andersonii.AAC.1
MALRGPGDSARVLCHLKYWCSQALLFDRKSAHAAFPFASNDLPPVEALLARVNQMPPPPDPAVLLADDELGALDGLDVAPPSTADASAPNARNRRQLNAAARGSGGRGRGRASGARGASVANAT